MERRRTVQDAIVAEHWPSFLYHRAALIHAFVSEGESAEVIASRLSMDPVQVRLIALTPLDAIPRNCTPQGGKEDK